MRECDCKKLTTCSYMNVRTVRVLKILDSVMILLGLVGFTIFGIVKFFRPMASWHRADFFA